MLRYKVERARDHFGIWDAELNAECRLPDETPEGSTVPLQWPFHDEDSEASARTMAYNFLAFCYRAWGYRPTTDAPFIDKYPYREIQVPQDWGTSQ
jgi:hypothetical protein